MDPIVIIHGWSDTSNSFNDLASIIKKASGTEPTIIRLADWISMHDEVSYQDISIAMQKAWKTMGLPMAPRSVNLIVHSTGGLIAREWMTSHYTPESVPIKRLVMLAPANFGSPLAHKGRSFLGRAIKGWGNPNFQTGTKILRGLELASPYSFNLANRDLFDSKNRWYGKNRVLATIFIGNTGYSGVSAIANEDGSDGTVRISTANLNSVKLNIELDENQKASYNLTNSNGAIAFTIIAGENHSSIVPDLKSNSKHMPLILKALNVTDDQYLETGFEFPWQFELDSFSNGTDKEKDRFQNTVTYLHDNTGQEVQDYFVEFYRKANSDKHFEKQLYERFIKSVHPYEDNPAYRSIYLDINAFEDIQNQKSFSIDKFYVSLTANPLFKPPNEPVGYMSLAANQTGGLVIQQNDLPLFFKAHRTLLVDITINRFISDDVFKLK